MLLHLILNQVPPPAPSLSFGFVECFGRQFLLMPHEYLRNSQTVDPCRRFLLQEDFLTLKPDGTVGGQILLSLNTEVENRFEYWKCELRLQTQSSRSTFHFSKNDSLPLRVPGLNISCSFYPSQ